MSILLFKIIGMEQEQDKQQTNQLKEEKQKEDKQPINRHFNNKQRHFKLTENQPPQRRETYQPPLQQRQATTPQTNRRPPQTDRQPSQTNYNNRQSAHTLSVHIDAVKSSLALRQRYPRIKAQESILKLMESNKTFPKRKIQTAVKFFKQLNRGERQMTCVPSEFGVKTTNNEPITTQEALQYVCAAINSNNSNDLLGPRDKDSLGPRNTAIECLIRALYEAAREYNLKDISEMEPTEKTRLKLTKEELQDGYVDRPDEHGNFLMDHPACTSGIF